MNTILTKTGSKRVILKTGKTISLNLYRELTNETELPPEPTTCCMSGCTNCVWVKYAEEVAKLMDGNSEKVQQIILSKITDPSLKMFLAVELKTIQYNIEQSKSRNSENGKDNLK